MKKTILQTLTYADIFDFPLRAEEIWEWQIIDGERNVISKEEIKKVLIKLESLGYCQEKNGYYYLKGREGIVKTREQRTEFSRLKLNRARKVIKILSFIPWVKLIGITGSLARENAGREDDIDLFVITSRNRLWLTRGLISLVLRITKLYRRPPDVANKFCPNLFVTEDCLIMKPQDLFTAHEICSMKPIFVRRETYFRFIRVNSWAKRFFPNAVKIVPAMEKEEHGINRLDFINILEKLAMQVQLKYMDSRRTSETVTENLIKFHPQDIREKILTTYQNRLKKTGSLLF